MLKMYDNSPKYD